MPYNKSGGKFITFEGGEGAGKSTQIKLLADYLKSKGHEVVTTREPGGTPGAEVIRELLLNGAVDKWDGLTEVLLNFAARKEHVRMIIKPALAGGKWVLCDRFFDSTFVYQGYGQGVDLKTIESVKKAVLGDFAPDITFLLDVDAKTALARAKDHNRYEQMGPEFHEKIRQGFLQRAKQEKRFVVIDTANNANEVHKRIVESLKV